MRVRLLACLLALLAAGCTRPVPGTPLSTEPGSSQATTTGPASAPTHRQAAVYAAVLRQYLTSTDHSLGDHRFPRIFVLDRAVAGAADPMREATADGGAPIPPAIRRAIADALADVGPLTFVASRDAVVEDRERCPRVRDQGVLVTLGPVVGVGDRAEVGVNGYVACLAATWLTYVVERNGSGWVVHGTTGPRAIS